MSGPYTIFNKAADHLVREYRMRRLGKINPVEPISPVTVILMGTLEKFVDIQSPFSTQEPAPGLVLSHIEDNAGPIPECSDQQYTLKANIVKITDKDISSGDLVKVHVMMTIKPHGMIGDEDFLINYHQNEGSYRLGLREVVFIDFIGR